jgi:hypothetical protein
MVLQSSNLKTLHFIFSSQTIFIFLFTQLKDI